MAFIRLAGIVKRFGKVAAIDDLHLEIEAGEFVSFLGPSGCGKTTTLRCIAGLERPDRGEIWLDDRLVFSLRKGAWVPPKSRSLSMVFQTYAVWPHMNVFENVAFGLKTKKTPHKEIADRVHETLSLVGIEALAKRYPYQLSGGQQQRVALARALVVRPSVLLMDEPLSNLDARLRMLMRDELKRLHHDLGTTAIYVTHDQAEALALSTRVVVMKEGIVQQIADPINLYENPSNLFVAQFVGNLSVNVLNLQVISSGEGEGILETMDGALRLHLPRGQISNLPDKVIGTMRPEDIGFERVDGEDTDGFHVIAVQFIGSRAIIRVKKRKTELTIEATGNAAADVGYDNLLRPLIDVKRIRFYSPRDQTLLSLLSPTN